ncbi:MAG: YfhO family protein [Anaerolineaceae bacterium]|nr:YfhO family protein [Anaerolineaceae bacterium]
MTVQKPWSRLDWLIILIFAGLVLLFYWRILTPNPADRQSFPPGDFHAQFWAFTTFEVRELSAGRLPLWNPYTFAGAPFWADVQAAVFYPPSLLTILLSAPWGFSLFALEIEAIAHFWLAAVFMYLFIRALTHSRAAAVVAALTFTFSGYLTGYPSQQLAVLEADIWLPLILYFLYRAHQSRTTPTTQLPNQPSSQPSTSPIPNYPLSIINYQLILAGLSWGLTLLAGHPQSALIVGYTCTAYFFFLNYERGTMNDENSIFSSTLLRPTPYILRSTSYILRSTLPAYLIFLLTGLGLAAIQFIPAVEYTLLSVRAEGAYDKMSGGFPLTDLIQLLLPGQVSFYSPLYVGLTGLILAIWVVFAAPNRHTIFWSIFGLLALLIAFGGNTFLYSPLYLWVPGFAIFRGQERWAFAVAFSLSVLAGYGFNTLLHIKSTLKHHIPSHPLPPQSLNSPSSFFILHSSFFILSLLLAFLAFFGLNTTGWTPISPFYGLLAASTLLTLLTALNWLLWRFATRLTPAWLTVLTAGLICFDLFSVNWQTNLYPQPPEWHTRMPRVVEVIKQDAAQTPDEPYRVYNEFRLYDNYGVPYAIEDLWGASPLRPNRYDQFLAPPMPIERTWELLNVKYVITWREELFVPSTILYQEPAADGTTYVHRLDEIGPRAWLVTQTQIADDAAILQTIADPNFDRWHIALLEPGSEPFIQKSDQPPSEPSTTTSYALHFTPLSPQSLSITVDTPTPTLLILSEPDYPGWQAAVDGQPAPLLRADYILRAVPVPMGDHTVQLTFRPPSFIIGAVISGITLVVVAILLVLAYRRRGAT